MAPLVPHWTRPSHPDVQDVVINEAEFTSKSLSKVSLPPFSLYAKMAFPPCTMADEPTYATVQIGRNKHLNLNSDLLYINHSCEPSLIFDTANFNILVGPKGLKPGDELTFFYPSTEWDMAQPFDCLCGTPTCRRRIGGAGYMTDAQLEGLWLNGHIHELLRERKAAAAASGDRKTNGHVSAGDNAAAAGAATTDPTDPTAQALKDALEQAEKVVVSARAALFSYAQRALPGAGGGGLDNGQPANGLASPLGLAINGSQRRGATSRELSGEMGGDTICA